MKLAIATGPYSDIHGPWRYPIEEIVKIASEAGYEGIELDVRHFDPVDMSLERQQEIMDTIQSYGLEVPNLACHQFYPVKNEAARNYRVNVFNKMLLAAKRFNVPIVGGYTGGFFDFRGNPTGISEENGWNMAVDCMKRNCRVAENLGIYVGLEAITGHVAHDFESTKKFMKAVNSSMLTIQLDPTHYVAYGDNLIEVIKYFDAKIKWIHLKDIAGIPKDKGLLTHPGRTLSVPLGKGIINWREFIDTLKEVGYDDWLSLEYGVRNVGYREPQYAAAGLAWLENGAKSSREFIERLL